MKHQIVTKFNKKIAQLIYSMRS